VFLDRLKKAAPGPQGKSRDTGKPSACSHGCDPVEQVLMNLWKMRSGTRQRRPALKYRQKWRGNLLW